MNETIELSRWFVMAPTLAVIVGIAVSWGMQQATTNQHKARLSRIEKILEDLPAIKTDLDWIKKAIDKN